MNGKSVRTGICGGLFLLLFTIGCGGKSGNPAEAEAVAAIRQMGGKVEFDEKSPDHPVLKVYLQGTDVKDSDLPILGKLSKLQNLFLGKTKISDTGVEHLKGMTQLQTLSLNSTAVTDAGLTHLTGLSTLKTLNLQETKVTAAGVDELKRTLPGVTIAR